MPTDLTDAAMWADVTAVPQDGDAASTDTGDGPLTPVLQKLANRDAYLAEYLAGLVIGRPVVRSNGSTVVVEGPFRAWLGRKGLSTFLTTLTYTCSGLSSGTWYYVYVYDNSGVLGIDVQTTGPDTYRVHKSGDTSRRYVGCFRATGTTACRPFRAVAGRVLYDRGKGVVHDDFQILGGDGDTAWTSIPKVGTGLVWADFVPPHAQAALLDVQFEARTSAVDSFQLRSAGDDGAAWSISSQAVAAGARIGQQLELPRSGTTALGAEYKVGHASAKGYAWVAGFTE